MTNLFQNKLLYSICGYSSLSVEKLYQYDVLSFLVICYAFCHCHDKATDYYHFTRAQIIVVEDRSAYLIKYRAVEVRGAKGGLHP